MDFSRAEESQVMPEIFCTFISSTRPGAFRSTNTCTGQDLLMIMYGLCMQFTCRVILSAQSLNYTCHHVVCM